MEASIGNVSEQAVAEELVEFLESQCGHGGVLSCSIETSHANWASRGFGYVRFSSPEAAQAIARLANSKELVFCKRPLTVEFRKNGMSHQRGSIRALDLSLWVGYLAEGSAMDCLWSSEGVLLELCYGSSQVNLVLPRRDGGETGPMFKLELDFADLLSVEPVLVSQHKKSLLLHLLRPPRVFKSYPTEPVTPVLDNPSAILRHYKLMKSRSDSYTYSKWTKEPNWVRTTDFTPPRAISQCLVYCLGFPDSESETYREVASLSDHDLERNLQSQMRLSLVEVQPYACLQQEAVPVLRLTCGYHLPLEVEYKLNSLVQSGHLGPSAAVKHSLLHLLQTCPGNHCVSALSKLEKHVISTDKTCLDPLPLIQTFLQGCIPSEIELDEGQTYVKRFIVTPCKVYCMGPEVEGSNRVTRTFKQYTDKFARVSFLDEGFGPLHSTATALPKTFAFQPGLLPEPSDVYYRVRSVLENGIRIGNEHFKFLAFSASQLREHSCWMFADSGKVTSESIRSWMGDFKGLKNVAKYAARMGQSFSSSKQGLSVPQHELSRISDITCSNGAVKYCFSDGIGKISRDFAIKLAGKAGCNLVPSAFQIRYGGYKGVVAVDPTSPFKMSLRPSMYKFESEQTGVDVLSWTKFAPYYLNRQIIILMSTLGVGDDAFLRMQEQEIAHLDAMLKDPVLAIEVLSASAGKQNRIAVDMLSAGYTPTQEPFLRKMLDSFRALQLHLLRLKSRVYVPKGRSLMGCLDETATLEYGQVFVQVCPTPGTRAAVDDGLLAVHGSGPSRQDQGCIVTGKVAIAKNPCLHPGDILVLKAIDVPALHHMIDCVVFPQRGKRPHPDECSGSDLDGDLYFVTWDPSLVPPCTVEPMSYEPSSPAVLNHAVTIKEVKDFFVDSMLNDSLGVISNAHLIHADLEVEKAKHPKCIELARLASTAVDFAKTGVPAVIPTGLRPRHYPDFMENEFRSTYRSESVLGKLYRLCSDSLPRYTVSTENILREYDSSLIVQGFESYVTDAVECRDAYNRKLSDLMRRHQVSEGEIITGNILNKANQKDDRERIGLAMSALLNEARKWFGDDGSAAKAYAWYHVTYHPEFRSSDAQELLSFPWVLSKELLRIKTNRV